MKLDGGVTPTRPKPSLPAAATAVTGSGRARLLRSNLAIVDQRLKQIMAVLYSNTTPADALKPQDEKTEPNQSPASN